MSEAKHTPLPWKWTPEGRGEWDDITGLEGADGTKIITLKDVYPGYSECGEDLIMEIDPKNAAFIVRAVNSHDELLAACEAALAEHPAENGRGVDLPQSLAATLRAAVAKARP